MDSYLDGYVNTPMQYLRDLMDGKLTHRMFAVLYWLHARANWKTGVVRRASAAQIRAEMWAGTECETVPSLKAIQRTIKLLDNCGYIKSHHVPGRRGTYSITLKNYVVERVADGVADKVVLNPADTLDWRELDAGLVADGVPDDVAEGSHERSHESDRESDPERSAYTLTSTDTPASPSSPPFNKNKGWMDGRPAAEFDLLDADL